jgi:hypothetical protein
MTANWHGCATTEGTARWEAVVAAAAVAEAAAATAVTGTRMASIRVGTNKRCRWCMLWMTKKTNNNNNHNNNNKTTKNKKKWRWWLAIFLPRRHA